MLWRSSYAYRAAAKRALAHPKRGARLREANRLQLAWGIIDLDE